MRKPPRLDAEYVGVGQRVGPAYDPEDMRELDAIIASGSRVPRAESERIRRAAESAQETLRRLAGQER